MAVVQYGETAYRASLFVSEKEFGAGMSVVREPPSVKAEAFVHLQGRRPLGNVPVNGEGQTDEVIHSPFIVMIEANDAHGMGYVSRQEKGFGLWCIINREIGAIRLLQQPFRPPCNNRACPIESSASDQGLRDLRLQ